MPHNQDMKITSEFPQKSRGEFVLPIFEKKFSTSAISLKKTTLDLLSETQRFSLRAFFTAPLFYVCSPNPEPVFDARPQASVSEPNRRSRLLGRRRPAIP